MASQTGRVDLHMHSRFSDGTDSPEALLAAVKKARLSVFSVTDHDGVKAGLVMPALTAGQDLSFIPGVEFSCQDGEGKYHILGYGFDPEAPSIAAVVEHGHALRMSKIQARIDFLKTAFGFTFPREELDALLSLDNPGKPHLGNLMVKYGYAPSKETAIREYIDQLHIPDSHIAPEEAISGILGAGGVPVVAHPFFGDGGDLILGADMEARLARLVSFGLAGLEAFYSGFSEKMRREALSLADRFDLFVTAGSDYHGANKLIALGDTGLPEASPLPPRMQAFLETVLA